MTRISFGTHVNSDEFVGALMYKLQRKKRLEFNSQSNADNAFKEDASTNLQFLVAWKIDKLRILIRALLIKHSNTITWDEDTLGKLHSMHLALLRDDAVVEDTWFLDDTTALMTTLKWQKEDDRAEITISEGTRKDDSMKPLWVSSNM
jgi:hypothetical protein